MRADAGSLPAGSAAAREKTALHDKSFAAYHLELKALREEHDDYEALKLKHASASAQMLQVSEELTASKSAQQGLESSLADVHLRLKQADAAAEDRIRAMTDSLDTAVAASRRQQSEHAKLQADITALHGQLAASQRQLADAQQGREAELQSALKEQHDRSAASEQALQNRLARAQEDTEAAERRADGAEAALQQLEASIAALQQDNAALQQESEAHKLTAGDHSVQYDQFSRQLQDAADALATKEAALVAADELKQRHHDEMDALHKELAELREAHAGAPEVGKQLEAVRQELHATKAEVAAACGHNAELEGQLHQQQQLQEKEAAGAGSAASSIAEIESQLKVERAKAEATVFARDRLKAQLIDMQNENTDLQETCEQLRQQLQETEVCASSAAEAAFMMPQPKAQQVAPSTAAAGIEDTNGDASRTLRMDHAGRSDIPPAAFVTLKDGSQLGSAAAEQMKATLESSNAEKQSLEEQVAGLHAELEALRSAQVSTRSSLAGNGPEAPARLSSSSWGQVTDHQTPTEARQANMSLVL